MSIIFNEKKEVVELQNENEADFKSLAKTNKLAERFIIQYRDFLDWNIVSENQIITVEIMVKCADCINWNKIGKNPNISQTTNIFAKYKGDLSRFFEKENNIEAFVKDYQHLIDWDTFKHTQKLSNGFLEAMGDVVNWGNVFSSLHDRNSEAFIRKNIHRINHFPDDIQQNIWQAISTHQTVSERFLRDFQTKIRFYFIGNLKNVHTLSDSFVEDFKYILDGDNIRKTQKNNLSVTYFNQYKKINLDDFYKNVEEYWLTTLASHLIDWHRVSAYTTFSEGFMYTYWQLLDKPRLFANRVVSEDFIRKIAPKIDSVFIWNLIFKEQTYSQMFLEEFIHKINLKDVSYNSKIIPHLSEDFIRKHQKEWNWVGIGQVKIFSEGFLREFADKWDWKWNIAYCQVVSEKFLRDFIDRLDNPVSWGRISQKQVLSENFIRDFSHKLDWAAICKHQILSEGFIKEFAHKVDWKMLNNHQQLSPDFRAKFSNNAALIDDSTMLKLNQSAWNIYLYSKNDKTELQKGLAFVEQALAQKLKTVYAGMPNYVEDTKVRILISLQRTTEAFAIVKWALEKDRNFQDFQDFEHNEAYLNWLKL